MNEIELFVAQRLNLHDDILPAKTDSAKEAAILDRLVSEGRFSAEELKPYLSHHIHVAKQYWVVDADGNDATEAFLKLTQ